MKIQLSRKEVYDAVQVYLLLKGLIVQGGGIDQNFTNKEGLHHLVIDVVKHKYDENEVFSMLKQKGFL